MNEPLDLAPELAQKQRIEDLAMMRKRDKSPFFAVARYEIKDVISELNIRLIQYSHTTLYSVDFRILQSVQDFQYLIIPLQTFEKKQTMHERLSKAVDFDKPVASLRDGKLIYFNQEKNSFTLERKSLDDK